MPLETDEKDEIDALAWWVSLAIKGAGGLLLILFVWLEFNKQHVIGLVVSTTPDLLLKSALGAYYTCWILGSTADLNLHRVTLARDPNGGRIPISAYFVFVGFILAAIALLWASKESKLFAAALAVFWIVLTIAGEYTRRLTVPMIGRTAQWYKQNQDFYSLEKLLIVTRYLFGPRMWHRNFTGFFLIGLLVLFSFSNEARLFLANGIHHAVPEVPLAVILPLVPPVLFTVFVAVTEGWQWYMRASAVNALKVLRELRRRYDLALRGG